MPLTIQSSDPKVPNKTLVPPYEHLEDIQQLKQQHKLQKISGSKWKDSLKKVFRMK